MIGVRLLLVAAFLFFHCDCGGKEEREKNNTRVNPYRLRSQIVVPRHSESGISVFSSSRVQPPRASVLTRLDEGSSKANAFSQPQQFGVSETSSASADSWRIWKYDCYNPIQWSECIEPTESVFHDGPIIFGALQANKFKDIISPAQMGKEIRFHKQVGTAIFRDGIKPDYTDASLLEPKGGYFSMSIFTMVGKVKHYHDNMNHLNLLFTSLLHFFFGTTNGVGLEAGPEVRAAVCGIFARAEVDLRTRISTIMMPIRRSGRPDSASKSGSGIGRQRRLWSRMTCANGQPPNGKRHMHPALGNWSLLESPTAKSAEWFVSTGKDNVINTWRTPDGYRLVENKESSSSVVCGDISANGHFVYSDYFLSPRQSPRSPK